MHMTLHDRYYVMVTTFSFPCHSQHDRNRVTEKRLKNIMNNFCSLTPIPKLSATLTSSISLLKDWYRSRYPSCQSGFKTTWCIQKFFRDMLLRVEKAGPCPLKLDCAQSHFTVPFAQTSATQAFGSAGSGGFIVTQHFTDQSELLITQFTHPTCFLGSELAAVLRK